MVLAISLNKFVLDDKSTRPYFMLYNLPRRMHTVEMACKVSGYFDAVINLIFLPMDFSYLFLLFNFILGPLLRFPLIDFQIIFDIN